MYCLLRKNKFLQIFRYAYIFFNFYIFVYIAEISNIKKYYLQGVLNGMLKHDTNIFQRVFIT